MGFHVLVLAGGSGTRLWPLSRATLPKHLLPLRPGGETLLRATVDRVAPLSGSIHVVTAAAQAQACLDALEGAAAVSMIAEPTARGTGPALGLAVHTIATTDPEATIASVHADHDVADDDAYRAAVVAAAGWASASNGLATVGLTPSAPATGLGYIALGDAVPAERWRVPAGTSAGAATLAAAAALPAALAEGFVEKPPLDVAEAFVRDGRHLWNLGLFAWTVRAFLDELAAADPVLDAGLGEVVRARLSGDEERAARLYGALPSVAVEPLVFERTARLSVVRAGFEWSDLGSWADLMASRRALADPDGNVVSGEAVLVDTRDCLVESLAGRHVAVVGAEGLVVVDTGDAVLVMRAAAAQRLRAVVDRLRSQGRDDML